MKHVLYTLCIATPTLLFANAIERVNVNSLRQETEQRIAPGFQGIVNSNYNAISADGRYVVYSSNSARIVPNDTNGVQDTFFYDRKTGKIERISVDALGNQSDAYSTGRAISDDGRYVLFVSAASTLVPSGGNGQVQALLKDRRTGAIELISKDRNGNPVATGAAASAMSPDARYVLIETKDANVVDDDNNGLEDGFIYDRQADTVERVNLNAAGDELTGFSGGFDMSDDARYVVFLSRAQNFANGLNGDGNDMQGYLRDRMTGAVSLITTATDGGVANSWSGWLHVSGDGSRITFASPASNLVDTDTNGHTDVFAVSRDQVGDAHSPTRISVSDTASQNLNGGSYEPEISRDGRFIVFFTDATDAISAGDANGSQSDVILVDCQLETVERINHAVDGSQGNRQTTNCTLNATGQVILFHSLATNLVPGDNNREPTELFSGQDVFVVQRQLPPPVARAILDVDSDGLDDDWETQYFGDLRFLASDDPDGDGLDNAAEFAAGSNPFGIDLTLKRGWNVVSIPHAMSHRKYSEFFQPPVAAAKRWDPVRQQDRPAFAISANAGTWLFDDQPNAIERAVPIVLP